MAERTMTERPIIFSAPMVRAILEGRKTQTRRVLKGANHGPGMMFDGIKDDHATFSYEHGGLFCRAKMSWSVGDTLWVREPWAKDGDCPFQYKAGPHIADDAFGVKWRSSIHMPRWASRITLKVTDVRVQRLQDISEDDAKEEGATWRDALREPDGIERQPKDHYPTAIDGFMAIWQSIHGPASWEANPWVAATTFERVKP